MNAAHLHLMINHIPVIGSFALGLLLLYGMLRKNEEVQKISLMLAVLLALASFAVSKTGHEAEDVIEDLPGVSESFIESHEEAAEKALIASEIAGGLALLSLILGMKKKSLASPLKLLTLAALFGSSAFLAWTAKLGGEIRHPEARPGFQVPAPESQPAHSHED